VQTFSAEIKEQVGALQAHIALSVAASVAGVEPYGITLTVGNGGVTNVLVDSSM